MGAKRSVIAVIDDDASVCKALKRLIGASDLDVETFASGETFLESLSAHRPDCVVLDLHMPGLSGVDVLKALACREVELPVIIITGRDEPSSRARCLAAGAVAYFAKPLDHVKLLEAIGDAVGDPFR
jgi:FixJ family two-component response regulator